MGAAQAYFCVRAYMQSMIRASCTPTSVSGHDLWDYGLATRVMTPAIPRPCPCTSTKSSEALGIAGGQNSPFNPPSI